MDGGFVCRLVVMTTRVLIQRVNSTLGNPTPSPPSPLQPLERISTAFRLVRPSPEENLKSISEESRDGGVATAAATAEEREVSNFRKEVVGWENATSTS